MVVKKNSVKKLEVIMDQILGFSLLEPHPEPNPISGPSYIQEITETYSHTFSQ